MSRKSSEQTRKRILESTWTLLSSEDGDQTRMADIAKEAGVSRQAVYLHFPSRAELLIAATHYIDEVQDVPGRHDPMSEATNGVERLKAFVEAWGGYIPVIYPGVRTLLALKDTDDDAAGALADRMTALHGECAAIISELEADGRLAKHLTADEAADLMWAIVSIRQWELLTIDRETSQSRYIELTQETLQRSLLN